MNAKPPTLKDYTFNPYQATLYVPKEAQIMYSAHKYWSRFPNIVGTDFSGTEGITAEDEMLSTEYYDINGVRVTTAAPGAQPTDLTPGIYITRRGNKISRLIIR